MIPHMYHIGTCSTTLAYDVAVRFQYDQTPHHPCGSETNFHVEPKRNTVSNARRESFDHTSIVNIRLYV